VWPAAFPGHATPVTVPAEGLEEIRGSRLGALSLGQKRRVELAAALLGDPAVLLLDEPTNDLDPLAVAWLRAQIEAHRRPDRLILIASHNLDELQRVAEHLVVLREGELVGTWDAEEVMKTDGSFQDFFLRIVLPTPTEGNARDTRPWPGELRDGAARIPASGASS
jgi:ABC-type multidrug transport system ATPase subunit